MLQTKTPVMWMHMYLNSKPNCRAFIIILNTVHIYYKLNVLNLLNFDWSLV